MKKILLIVLILLGIAISGGTVSAKRELGKGAYINENGVKIFKKDYEKLVTLGFDDREILQFNQQEYDFYIEKNIDFVKKERYFIETNTTEVNGKVVTSQTLMNENQFYQKVNEEARSESTNLEKGGGMQKNASGSTSSTSGFMVLTVTATYDGCQGPTGEVFVKANLEWTSVPTQRMGDLLAITFSPNLYLKRSDVYGGNKPDFFTRMFYTFQTISLNPLTLGYDETFEQRTFFISPNHTSDYKESSNYIASQVQLPLDNPHLYYSECVYDFLITTECTLVPYTSNLSQASVGAVYVHQYGFGYFEWDRVNFYLNSPYFSYTNSIIINVPEYMDPVVGTIQFTEMVTGHQFYVYYYNSTFHSYKCSECGYTYQEDHIIVDNHCTVCDYYIHDHQYTYKQNISSHTGTCTICGSFYIEPHSFVLSWDDKKHYQICSVCDYIGSQIKHLFLLNGGKTCIECGYTKP